MTLTIFFLALFSPLASAVLSLFQKRRTIYFSVLALVISSACIIYLLSQRLELVWNIQWFSVGERSVSACAFLNSRTLAMSALISVLSLLVHVYSLDYLKDDERIVSFFGNLGLFTFSMLGLAVSGNLLLAFCFWELVGFSSYCLIGHWRHRPQAAYAAAQSFLVNRLADVCFVIALALLWRDNGSLEYSVLLGRTQSATAFILLFIGVMGKSAQLPFSGWLLNAMEGPTPASALIHSATMVAAGVYLLVIISPIIPPPAFDVILAVGSLTCVLAGIGALLHFDLKKILAYSTISQLGLMMAGIGADIPQGAFFHLFTHAFIKAGLFLAAGIAIHVYQTQDIRMMNDLRKKLPVLFYAIAVALASLAGIPFTAGFASKEIILECLLDLPSTAFYNAVAVINLLAATVTALYCTRLVVFFARWQESAREVLPSKLAFPFFISLALSYLAAVLFVSRSELLHFNSTALISTAAIAAGIASGILFYRNNYFDSCKNFDFILEKPYQATVAITHFAAARTLLLDRLIDKFIHASVYLKVIFANMIGWFDRNIADGLVTLFAKTLSGFGQLIRAAVSGQVQSYLAWSVAFILLLILFAVFS